MMLVLTNRVPHSLDACITAPVALEPVLKADVIECSDVPHATLWVKQGTNYGAGAKCKRVGQLVYWLKLRGGEESLQT